MFVQKINATTGASIWKVEAEGLVRYVSGKFVYTVACQQGDAEDDTIIALKTGFERIPHIRIKRLDPSNGRVMWEHYHRHAPLDVRFDRNTINFLCKNEMQVLKFISF